MMIAQSLAAVKDQVLPHGFFTENRALAAPNNVLMRSFVVTENAIRIAEESSLGHIDSS